MMRFRYVGPEDQVSIFGATFVRGEPVEVLDPDVARKLSRHPEFAPADSETSANAVSTDLMEATSEDTPGSCDGNAAAASRARRRRDG